MFRAATYNIRCRCSKFQNSATFTSPQTTPRKTTLARSVNPKSRSNRSNSNSFGRSVLLCAAPIALALPAFALGVNCQEKQEQADKSRNTTLRIWPFPSSSPYPTEEETPNITAEMTTTPSTAIMPGRPETLTAEEEAKLKDLWNKVLKCFGVAGATSGDNTPSGSATPSGAVTPTESNGTEKKKTTSLGRLLSRREKTPAAPATPAADDLDDKYGASKDYQTVLASQTPAELRDAFWAMVTCDHPDGLLLRFLRARKWDVEKALVMMVATMHWRIKEMDVAGVVKDGESGPKAAGDEEFMKQLRMGKSFLHGTDKDGRPICFVRVRLHKQADQSERVLERFTIYTMETARLMLRTPVDTACVLFDMTNFSLANMDYAPVKFMIKCFEAHYPESLGICLVHKAPWVFQGIWSIIKGWLDPVVASKIHFTKTTEELEQFIPRSHILKEIGGDEDWEYTYVEPIEGEDDALKDTARLASLQPVRDAVVIEYEQLTREWIAAAAGSEESDEKKTKRNELAKKLAAGYWEMDKHLRGRTVYDRTGVLGPDGSVNFYPKKQEQPKTSEDDID